MSIGKGAPIEPCALCTVPSALIHSHILPRWAYKRIAEDRPDRPVPVAVEGDVVMFQSTQLADFLLCAGCEDKTRAWDGYAAQVSYAKGKFPILEHALANVIPDPGNTTRLTIADVSGLDVSALVLFGTSVLWRAAACPNLCPTMRFGPYFDTFRTFVLAGGKAPFPSKARLLLTLMHTPNVPQAQQVITKPGAGRMQSCRMYRFMVFGMCFELFVGGLESHLRSFDGGCLARTQRVVVTTATATCRTCTRRRSEPRRRASSPSTWAGPEWSEHCPWSGPRGGPTPHAMALAVRVIEPGECAWVSRNSETAPSARAELRGVRSVEMRPPGWYLRQARAGDISRPNAPNSASPYGAAFATGLMLTSGRSSANDTTHTSG